MKRIIAHGCSCTYGHSLEDCVDPVNAALPGPFPSKKAYPQLIADTLGRECINVSTPGIGNLNILRNILNFDYRQDDIVIVMWTSFCRSTLIRDDDSNINFNPWLLAEDHPKGLLETYVNYLRKNNNLTRNEYIDIAHKFYQLNSDRHLKYMAWIYMDYARLKLKDIGVEQFHITWESWDPSVSSVEDPRNTDQNFSALTQDFGVDKIHPGPITHRIWADKILGFF